MQTGFGKVTIEDKTGKSDFSTSIDIGEKCRQEFWFEVQTRIKKSRQ